MSRMNCSQLLNRSLANQLVCQTQQIAIGPTGPAGGESIPGPTGRTGPTGSTGPAGDKYASATTTTVIFTPTIGGSQSFFIATGLSYIPGNSVVVVIIIGSKTCHNP